MKTIEYYMKLPYKLEIFPDPDEGGYVASYPDLPGCLTMGETIEDAIRNAISIGGDSDTIGAITGAVAEAYYGIPDEIKEKAKTYIPEDLLKMVLEFEKTD